MALIQMNITSMCLKRPVQINAFLPVDPMLLPGMGAPKGPWKTIYLLHGYTGSCNDWLGNDKIAEISKIYNVAVILPDGENHFWVDAKRRGDMYGEFIGHELIQITRNLFPLSHKREDTILAGISMGGYGAIRNGLKYNDVFSHIIACSPAIIIDDINPGTVISTVTGCTKKFYRSVFGDLQGIEASDLSPTWLAAEMAKQAKTFPDIFWGCGINDMLVEPSRRLDRVLTSLNVAHEYKEFKGSHEPIVFEPTLSYGLNRILEQAPAVPNPFWID